MKKAVFLIGPTAVGKTEISIHLARHFSFEIISADSMQVYQGLNIGTAKPPESHRKSIPHHLIDIVEPSRDFSVFEFRELALQKIEQIIKKDKTPLIVGGSGLYIKALIDGLAAQPGGDETLREKLRQQIKENGPDSLYQELKKIDPATAEKIQPEDERRIIRALEVYTLSKKKPSEWHHETVSLEDLGYHFLLLGLTRERGELYSRSEHRVDAMMEEGLLDEVRRLDYASLSKTTLQAVGYKELFEHLNQGLAFEEAVALIKKNTRHLVKKQLTWFRKEKRIEWFEINDTQTEKIITEKLIQRIKAFLQK